MMEDNVRQLIAHIDPSSFQPRSETLGKGIVLKAAALGIVGPEYVLKQLQLPDADEALKERQTELFKIWQTLQQKGRKRKGGP
jgi:hypothetical protein